MEKNGVHLTLPSVFVASRQGEKMAPFPSLLQPVPGVSNAQCGKCPLPPSRLKLFSSYVTQILLNLSLICFLNLGRKFINMTHLKCYQLKEVLSFPTISSAEEFLVKEASFS